MLTITGLMKTYRGGVQALKGVDLHVPSGMFGLLGPNGSGKTTLMNIVATLLEPDAGKVVMNEVELVTHKDHGRRMLGYLPQEFGFYPSLTAEQTLDYLAKLKGVWQPKERREPVVMSLPWLYNPLLFGSGPTDTYHSSRFELMYWQLRAPIY